MHICLGAIPASYHARTTGHMDHSPRPRLDQETTITSNSIYSVTHELQNSEPPPPMYSSDDSILQVPPIADVDDPRSDFVGNASDTLDPPGPILSPSRKMTWMNQIPMHSSQDPMEIDSAPTHSHLWVPGNCTTLQISLSKNLSPRDSFGSSQYMPPWILDRQYDRS